MSTNNRLRSPVAVVGTVAAVLLIALGTWFASAHLGSGSALSEKGATDSSSPTIAEGPVPDLHAASTTAYPALSNTDAIAATLQGFPKNTFDDLELAPTDPKLNEENRLNMDATVNVASSSGADVNRAGWEGCLADGAMSEYLVGDSNNLGTAVQGRVMAKLPDGSTQDAGGCSGDIAAGQLFGAQADHSTDAEIVSSVEQALADLQLTVVRVSVLRPLGPAVDVTVAASSAGSAMDALASVSSVLDAKPFLYEGVFLEVDGPDGTPLIASASALRNGTDGEWESHLLPGVSNPLAENP